MAYDGTIELSEDKVKQIIKQHLEDEGYTISDEQDPININIRKGNDSRFGYIPPSLRNIKVKIKV